MKRLSPARSALRLAAYLWSLTCADVYAVLDFRDPKPFLTMVGESVRRLGRSLLSVRLSSRLISPKPGSRSRWLLEKRSMRKTCCP